MGRRARHHKKQAENGPPPARSIAVRWWPAWVAVAALAVVALWPRGASPPTAESLPAENLPVPVDDAAPPAEDRVDRSAAPATADAPRARVEDVMGNWLREGEQYALVIKKVAADGKADVEYFNPQPIHVGKAEVTRDGNAVNVFVELRDTGYPGSTYRLQYDRRRDALTGTYFLPQQQETFDVVFVRATNR